MKETKPMKIKGMKSQRGFTTLELLIAISILTVGLLGVASMQVSGIRGNYFSAHTTMSLTLAEEKMEELLALTYTHADLQDSELGNNSDLTTTATLDHDETVNDPGGSFHRIWNVRDEDTGAGWPDMKTITVIVEWENNKHRVMLTSLRHE
jgi:prepilin-type N-terminal cleavage/methylation domain-containing protein